MGQKSLGVLLEGKKFLTGIIPKQWIEEVYFNDDSYVCKVWKDREFLTQGEYKDLIGDLKKEFGSLFKKIERNKNKEEVEVDFLIYLHRSKNGREEREA